MPVLSALNEVCLNNIMKFQPEYKVIPKEKGKFSYLIVEVWILFVSQRLNKREHSDEGSNCFPKYSICDF